MTSPRPPALSLVPSRHPGYLSVSLLEEVLGSLEVDEESLLDELEVGKYLRLFFLAGLRPLSLSLDNSLWPCGEPSSLRSFRGGVTCACEE